MRIWVSILLFGLLSSASCRHVKWDASSTVKVDLDCDGVPDSARIGYMDRHVRLAVTLGASSRTQALDFGIGESAAQDSLCGTDVALTVEDTDYDPKDALGDNPEGFVRSKTCEGLNLGDGRCDAMHIYWNHVKKRIDWWRL